MTARLHHVVFRCRDTEETRVFYEDVIGLPLAAALPLTASATGRPVRAMHSFFQLKDGSFVAFFEVEGAPFEFKEQHDFDLHLALEASDEDVERAAAAARARGSRSAARRTTASSRRPTSATPTAMWWSWR